MNEQNTSFSYTDAVWKESAQMPRFPQLQEDIHTDVLVIGGGLAGICCAWSLKRAGIDCVLIEANRLMSGVSGRTTAKITSQHGLIYSKLLRKYGSEAARLYWKANEDALNVIRHVASETDCDFMEQRNYLYQRDGTDILEQEMRTYEQLKIPATWENTLELPFPVAGGISFSNQAQFHPVKFAAYLSAGLRIYENTKAFAFHGNQIETPNAVITAKKVIVATHFPMLNKHGSFFLKLYQQRSYVIALENTEPLDGMYLDCAENGLSLRSSEKWLLLGGGGHRTGKEGAAWSHPEKIARKYYPQGTITARWATQDCMTLDGMPYIGQYSKYTPDLYVATGFQKWGMTTSMAAGQILKDIILERENPYASLFSPSRSILHRQLLNNGVETALNLICPTTPRCPHLGCALRWNKAEHSWDCSCHGSRFAADGKVLDNPASDDLPKAPS